MTVTARDRALVELIRLELPSDATPFEEGTIDGRPDLSKSSPSRWSGGWKIPLYSPGLLGMVNEIRKDGLPPSLCPLPKRDWTLGWLCLAGTGWKNQISIPKIWVLSLLFCPKHEKTQIEPESKKKQGEPDTRSKQGKRICKREQQGWESNSPSACERRGGGLNSRDGSWAGVSIVISTLWNWLRWGPSVLQWFRLGLIGLQWLVKRLMSGSFPVMQKAPILARIELPRRRFWKERSRLSASGKDR